MALMAVKLRRYCVQQMSAPAHMELRLYSECQIKVVSLSRGRSPVDVPTAENDHSHLLGLRSVGSVRDGLFVKRRCWVRALMSTRRVSHAHIAAAEDATGANPSAKSQSMTFTELDCWSGRGPIMIHTGTYMGVIGAC